MRCLHDGGEQITNILQLYDPLCVPTSFDSGPKPRGLLTQADRDEVPPHCGWLWWESEQFSKLGSVCGGVSGVLSGSASTLTMV